MHSTWRVITTHRHVATSTLNTTSHHVTVLKCTARSTAMCSLLSLLWRWESMQRVMCRCTKIHLFEGNKTIDILPSLLPTLHLLRYHPKSTAHYAATHSTVSPSGDHESPRMEWCRCTTKDRHLGKWRVSGRLNLRLLISGVSTDALDQPSVVSDVDAQQRIGTLGNEEYPVASTFGC